MTRLLTNENPIIDIEDLKKMRYPEPEAPKKLPQVERYFSPKLGYNDGKTEYNSQGGALFMNEKEYVDLKVNALEQNLNQKIEAQGTLFVEKLNHLETKIDGQHAAIMSKFDSLSDTILNQKELIKKDAELITHTKIKDLESALIAKGKENRNFTWMVMGFAVAAATLIATVAIPLIQAYLTK